MPMPRLEGPEAHLCEPDQKLPYQRDAVKHITRTYAEGAERALSATARIIHDKVLILIVKINAAQDRPLSLIVSIPQPLHTSAEGPITPLSLLSVRE